MALFESEWGWRGIYSLHQESNCYNLLTQLGDTQTNLGETDLVNLVTVRIFGGTEMQLGRTDMVRVRA